MADLTAKDILGGLDDLKPSQAPGAPEFNPEGLSFEGLDSQGNLPADDQDPILAALAARRSPTQAGSGPAIPREQVYAPESGILGHALGGLDYSRNVAASSILGMGHAASADKGPVGQAGTGLEYAKQAALKKRYTSGQDVKDEITQRYGLGKVRFGRDDNRFQTGDLLDFGVNLGLDTIMDPLTYVTAGANVLAKKGTEGVVKSLVASRAIRGGIGGLLGFGAADKDAGIAEKAADTAIGVGLGLASGPALDAAGKTFRSGADSLSNWYATTTRGSRFSKVTEAFKAAQEGYSKVRNLAAWIRSGRNQALEGLDLGDKLVVSDMMRDLKTETIRRRAAKEAALGIQEGTPEWNAMAHGVNDEVEKEYLPKLLEGKAERVGKAVKDWADHNDAVVKKLNNQVFGLTEGVADDAGKGIVGQRFHIDDVYKKADFEGAGEVLKDVQIARARSLERSKEVENAFMSKMEKQIAKGDMTKEEVKHLANETSYAIYSEGFANKFLDKTEREAMSLVNDYRDMLPKQKFAQNLERGLKTFDKITNFTKANMLYFSMTWVKNNYFDNVAKAYAQNGMLNMMDTATLGSFRSGLAKDINALYKGDISRAYKSAHFQDMLNLGVLDNTMFKSMTDEMTRDFLFSPKQILEHQKESVLNKIGRNVFTQNPITAPVIKTMNKVGSFMEGTARATTYINTLESLQKTASLKGTPLADLKRMAAKISRDTFFDYGDVSMLEKAVFKRIIPFYSFYSKNLPYWLGAHFDPKRVGRIANLEHARKAIGREPNENEKLGMTPYLAGAAPRMMGTDKHGNAEYLVLPSSSQYEAIKNLNPMEWTRQLVEKGHPIPKTVYELTSGKDLFAGGSVYPSDSYGGKKYLYSRGFKYYAVQKALEKLGFDTKSTIQKIAGTAGVKVDSKGNPYTTDDYNIVLDRIASTVFPHGFVDQIAGSVGKVSWNKEKWDEAILNRVLPSQTVKVSPDYARLVRARNMKAQRHDRRGNKK